MVPRTKISLILSFLIWKVLYFVGYPDHLTSGFALWKTKDASGNLICTLCLCLVYIICTALWLFDNKPKVENLNTKSCQSSQYSKKGQPIIATYRSGHWKDDLGLYILYLRCLYICDIYTKLCKMIVYYPFYICYQDIHMHYCYILNHTVTSNIIE